LFILGGFHRFKGLILYLRRLIKPFGKPGTPQTKREQPMDDYRISRMQLQIIFALY
jgi:hypothetical protein